MLIFNKYKLCVCKFNFWGLYNASISFSKVVMDSVKI